MSRILVPKRRLLQPPHFVAGAPAIIRPDEHWARVRALKPGGLGVKSLGGKRRRGGWSSILTHPTLSTNLIAYWRLEEASGTRNATVGGVNLTENGGTISGVAAKQGNGADFEQSSSQYLANTSSNFVSAIGAGAFSWSGWIRSESISGNQVTHGAGLFANVASEADGSSQIAMRADGKLVFKKFTGTNRSYKTDAAVCSALSTWFHIAFTYSGSGTDISSIYVNDALTAATDDGNAASGWGSGTFIGAQWASGVGGYSYDGIIDEVGLWSKVLSAQEITALYFAGAGIPYS